MLLCGRLLHLRLRIWAGSLRRVLAHSRTCAEIPISIRRTVAAAASQPCPHSSQHTRILHSRMLWAALVRLTVVQWIHQHLTEITTGRVPTSLATSRTAAQDPRKTPSDTLPQASPHTIRKVAIPRHMLAVVRRRLMQPHHLHNTPDTDRPRDLERCLKDVTLGKVSRLHSSNSNSSHRRLSSSNKRCSGRMGLRSLRHPNHLHSSHGHLKGRQHLSLLHQLGDGPPHRHLTSLTTWACAMTVAHRCMVVLEVRTCLPNSKDSNNIQCKDGMRNRHRHPEAPNRFHHLPKHTEATVAHRDQDQDLAILEIYPLAAIPQLATTVEVHHQGRLKDNRKVHRRARQVQADIHLIHAKPSLESQGILVIRER